jgi:hypothetical protein
MAQEENGQAQTPQTAQKDTMEEAPENRVGKDYCPGNVARSSGSIVAGATDLSSASKENRSLSTRMRSMRPMDAGHTRDSSRSTAGAIQQRDQKR